jgi:hypothetical protein
VGRLLRSSTPLLGSKTGRNLTGHATITSHVVEGVTKSTHE